MDLLIKGGTVVDGTGRPAFPADIAVDGERIVAVEPELATSGAGRVIDADGLLVTPGFVDIHTHFDGQVTWDPVVAPSSLHGVTSIVMGNCGVGFAPARRSDTDHDWLIGLLEGVEDIPGTALAEGLAWDWESFPDYLDALERRAFTVDVGTQVAHAPLRAYVMGERGAEGLPVRAQVAPRPIGLLAGYSASVHPFMLCPSYHELAALPLGERVVALADPERRRRIVSEHGSPREGLVGQITHRFDLTFPLTDPVDYEPPPEASVAGIAAAEGRPAAEVAYDLLLRDGGNQLLYLPLFNYVAGNLDDVREMLLSEHVVLGLSDAGAHCGVICDGSMPTTALALWSHRRRGEGLPVEVMVQHLTQRTAHHIGWHDRGVLAPGLLADINVIDLDALGARPPRIVHDLPAGGRRLMQHATGYRHTIKRGVETFAGGEATGAAPGRVVRGATQ